MRNNKIAFSAFVALIFTSLMVSAGPITSSGGKGVVCRDSDRRVLSVELLDLWEAKHLFDREPKDESKSVEKIVSENIRRLKFFYYSQKETRRNKATSQTVVGYDSTENRLKMISEMFIDQNGNLITGGNLKLVRNIRLNLTPDSYEIISPLEPNCEIEQIVHYFDYGYANKIILNLDLYEKMDSLNKAALILHESLYAVLREESKEETSVRVRRAIGLVMNGEVIRDARDYVQGQRRLECTDYPKGHQTRVYFVESSGGGYVSFVPEIIDGVYILGQTFNQGYSHIKLDDLMKPGAKLRGSEINLSSIDFDIVWEFSYRETSGSNPDITINVDKIANGVSVPLRGEATCKLTSN